MWIICFCALCTAEHHHRCTPGVAHRRARQRGSLLGPPAAEPRARPGRGARHGIDDLSRPRRSRAAMGEVERAPLVACIARV